MATHARLSPSSAERWMTCPGSVALCDGLPDQGSEYADEGTAAHFLASECLSKGKHPVEYLGQRILVDKEGGTRFDDAGKFEVDVDMAGHVNHYVQAVREQAKDGVLLVEVAVPIGDFTFEEDATGTADAVVITADGELQVHDFKYGQGVMVEAFENKQLLLYALGANSLLELAHEYDRVRVFVHQPRKRTTPSEYACGLAYLEGFASDVKHAAVAVTAAADERELLRGSDTWVEDFLAPSDDACRWCRAKTQCPALYAVVSQSTALAFQDLDAPPALNTLTLGDKMRAVPMVEKWCKAVRAEVESELFAGHQVDGFKIVQGRQGNRAWTDPVESEKLMKEIFRLKVEEMYELKLISPTSAEKLKKAGTIGPRQWKKLEVLITRADGQPSVAPESDPRPALTLQASTDDFEVIEEDLL